MPLFLQVSGDWQVVMHVVPGHILLPYQQVTSDQFDWFVKMGMVKLGKWDHPRPQVEQEHDLAISIATNIAPEILKLIEAKTHTMFQELQRKLIRNGKYK